MEAIQPLAGQTEAYGTSGVEFVEDQSHELGRQGQKRSCAVSWLNVWCYRMPLATNFPSGVSRMACTYLGSIDGEVLLVVLGVAVQWRWNS